VSLVSKRTVTRPRPEPHTQRALRRPDAQGSSTPMFILLRTARWVPWIASPGLGDDELDAVITEGLRRQLAAGVTTVRDLGDLWYGVVKSVATCNAPVGRGSRSRQLWRRVRP
jgi:hypothetical protein